MRVEDASVTNGHIRSDGYEGTDVAVLADLRRRVYERHAVNAFLLGLHRCIHLHELGNGLIGILHADECGLHGFVEGHSLVDEHHARLGVVDVVQVFRVGKEGDGSLLSFFYLCERIDDSIGIALYMTLYQVCYLLCGKFHIVMFLYSILLALLLAAIAA